MGNLLADCVITNAYGSKSASNPKTWTNGELYFSGSGVSAGSTYIEIQNTGCTYYFDCEITVSTGNQFYIGFERYDKDKTATSNNSCVYPVGVSNTGCTRKRFQSTVNLSKDNLGNDVKFIALRILSGWSGSTDASNSNATVHYLSLRENQTVPASNMNKSGVVNSNFFNELNPARIYSDGIVESINFIEI